jgi:hypothetical protein
MAAPAGRFFFHVMASLAQMERELIVERTRAGLDAAKKQGRIDGRKRLMTEKKLSAARKLLALGTLLEKLPKTLGSPYRPSIAGCPLPSGLCEHSSGIRSIVLGGNYRGLKQSLRTH